MFFATRKRTLGGTGAREPGLHRRILNTLLLVLLFRLLANIPVVNVDDERMHELLARNPLLGAIDLFAGGDVLRNFSIVAVGLFPYLLAAGCVQLGAWWIPSLRALREQGGEERLKRYTRAATLPVAVVLAWGIMRHLSLETGRFPANLAWFTRSEFLSTLAIVGVITFGSWLTERIKEGITRHGIGRGDSVLLIVGSSLALVTWISDSVYSGNRDDAFRQIGLNVILAVIVIVLGIPLLSATRNIPMTSARAAVQLRRAGSRHLPPTYLPLRLNRDGTAPVSSAVGFLLLFQIAAMALAWAFPGRFQDWQDVLLAPTKSEHGLYWVLLAVLTIGFTYASNFTVLWKPFANSDHTLAESLRRDPSGVFIPGVRPGARTDAYLSWVTARITLPAAVVLAVLAAGLPYLVLRTTGQNVSVVVLAELVFVRSFLELRDRYRVHRIVSREYEGLLAKRS